MRNKKFYLFMNKMEKINYNALHFYDWEDDDDNSYSKKYRLSDFISYLPCYLGHYFMIFIKYIKKLNFVIVEGTEK